MTDSSDNLPIVVPNNLPEILDSVDPGQLISRKNIASGVAFFTGLLTSSRKELVLSGARIAQAGLAGKLLRGLSDEAKTLHDKGKVKSDYFETDQYQECLLEMLETLDNNPNKTTFEFLKKIFLAILTESISSRDDLRPQQYLQIAKTLNSGEVLLLTAIYKKGLQPSTANSSGQLGLGPWFGEMVQLSGLGHQELVELYEKSLIEKHLVTPRASSGTANPGAHNRLTTLGLALFKFVEEYEKKAA